MQLAVHTWYKRSRASYSLFSRQTSDRKYNCFVVCAAVAKEYKHAGLTIILPGAPGKPVSSLTPLPYILCLTSSSHPPCPSQTRGGGEGTAVKEEEWKESTFYEG